MTAQAFQTLHVIQGEQCTSDQPDTVLTTVLGSCVAACLHDPVRRIGGMNHFLLPDQIGTRDLRYATAAMEVLVNSLIKKGAVRSRLEAKLFGGSRMLAGLPDIGRRNGEAAIAFLHSEGIKLQAQSLGGTLARRVRFWPTTGKAQQILLHKAEDIPQRMPPYPPVGTIEIF